MPNWLTGLKNFAATTTSLITTRRQSERSGNMSLMPKASGTPGTKIVSGMIEDLDPNTALRGDLWYGTPYKMGIASQMMRDPYVRTSIDSRSAPIRAATWDFKPFSQSDRDKEVADFCRWVFLESLPWDRFLRQAVTGYNRDGFVFFEVTDETVVLPQSRFPNHPGGDLGVAFTGLHHRPAWTVNRFIQNQEIPSQLDAIEQWGVYGDAGDASFVTIPADRLIRFTYEQEGADFTGLSRLRSAYGCWKSKLTFQVLNAIRHERQAVGTPSMSLPDDATDDEVTVAQQILSEMRSHEKGYLVLPSGYKFEWAESSAGAGTDIEAAIEQCNRDIYMNVHVGFMYLGASEGGGSFALATSQQSLFNLSLETETRFICDTINKGSDGWSPVRRLVDLNYGPDVPAPSLVARNMPTRDWTQLLPVAFNQINAGGLLPDKPYRDFVREVLFLPPESEDAVQQVMQLPNVSSGTNPAPMEEEDDL